MRSQQEDPPGDDDHVARDTRSSESQSTYQCMRDQYNSRSSDSRRSNHNQQEKISSPTKIPNVPSFSDSCKKHNYRGFSTSIGDMFSNPAHERVDCCSMTCCGIFQSDRDRYLLQGVTPPSPFKRFWVHFCVPLMFFIMAGYVALNVPAGPVNQMMTIFFLLLLLGAVVTQTQKGRAKRMNIRKDVLWYRYQLLKHQHDDKNVTLDQILDQHRPYNDHDTSYYRGQTERDIRCSHPCCFLIGCYPNDQPTSLQLAAAASDDTVMEVSLCSCLYRFFCRPVCGMHLQLGGVCGMAQESREIEATLLPPAYRRLDYVTMQPMLNYFEEIYNQRWRQFHTNDTAGVDGPQALGPFQTWPHLSGLSRIILLGWFGLTVFLGVWSVVGPIFWTQFLKGEGRRHFFSVGDYVVYLSSWIVSLGTLAVVVYCCQRQRPLELSVDAMIKYFACGFVLSTTLSIFYEIVLGLTLRLAMMAIMVLSGVEVVEDKGYENVAEWTQHSLLSVGFGAKGGHHLGITAAVGGNYLPVFGRDHPFIYSIYLFVNAYVLAALVEEICKYFGYRMMEHPDFMGRKDLEDAAGVAVGERRTEQRRSKFPRHGESKEAQGAAITVAMVCVALGLSCCEDLVYVFLYNGSSVDTELYVLIARAFFPIHPIAAALQSIGVCERDVEKTPTRTGRILLPAVLFHGTYDFLLLWIDFLASLKRQDGYDAPNSDEALEIGTHAVIGSFATSFLVMAAAMYWFYKESNHQRERLVAADAAEPEFTAL